MPESKPHGLRTVARGCARATALVAIAALGCGGPPAMVPVEGVVTVGGKPPAEKGYVYFLPHDSGAAAGNHAADAVRPGSGSFGPDGRYVVTSIRPNDGLAPGTYAIRLEFWGDDRGHETPAESGARPKVMNASAVRVSADGPRPLRHDIDVVE